MPSRVAKKVPDETYVVDPPDVIKIEFVQDVEFVERTNLTRQVTLRSDGCVTLPLLEDVKVGGMTTAQIREKLEKLYSEYYKEPEILVTVAAYRSKHIYVYGEVGRRGVQPYTGYQTLSDAIGAAGGVTTRAASTRVKVIRGDLEDQEVYRINLKKLIFKGDKRYDVTLAEDDVIYVPPTVLAWIGYQIQSLLFPVRSAVSLGTTPGQL